MISLDNFPGNNQSQEGANARELPGAVQQALPLLQALRSNSRILEGRMPLDHELLPGEDVAVKPYYMNPQDPDTVGVWNVRVGELEARVLTYPGSGGLEVRAKTKGESGARWLTSEEDRYFASVIMSLNDAWREDQIQMPEKSEKAVIVRRLGKLLGFRE